MGLAGYWDVPITIINSTMPLIILIVGYADAIHLILSVRDHLANGFTKDQAVALAVRQLWAPCFFTSLTTAVGFASLMISHVGTIRDFGALTALGCVINFFAVLLVVPIAASFFGDQLSRPRRSGDANSHRSEPFAATSHWLGKFVARFAKPITVAGLCSIAFSLWCTTQLHTSNRLADSIPHDGPTYQTYRMCEEKFGGAAEIYVRVAWSDDQSLQSPQVIKTLLAVEDAVRRQKNLGPPLSVLDVMRSLPDPFEGESLSGKQILALHQLGESARERMLNEQRHRAIVTARVPDMGVDELRAVMNQLESELKTQTVNYANIDVAVVGEIATTVRIFQQLVTDLLWSVLLASVVIFSLMTLQFRSWRVGLLSVVPSAFSLLGAAAILYLSGTPLQLASLVSFTICLGISVDDTIHFLARYRVLRPRLDRETASVETLVHIGPALFITSVVFVIGFGTVLLSRVPVLQTFSWLACVSLILALAGDTLLLPALLVTLARLSPKKSQARAASQAAVAMIPPPAHLHANKGASTETVSPSDGRLRPGNSSENRNAI
jgi:predicted RND superfamily exporter protein